MEVCLLSSLEKMLVKIDIGFKYLCDVMTITIGINHREGTNDYYLMTGFLIVLVLCAIKWTFCSKCLFCCVQLTVNNKVDQNKYFKGAKMSISYIIYTDFVKVLGTLYFF